MSAQRRARPTPARERREPARAVDEIWRAWVTARGHVPVDWYGVYQFQCWMQEHHPALQVRLREVYGTDSAQDWYAMRYLHRGDAR